MGGGRRKLANARESQREREREGEKLREFRGNRNSGMVENERARRARNSLLAAVAKFSASSARRRHYHKCLIHERRTRAKRLRGDSSVNACKSACNPPHVNRVLRFRLQIVYAKTRIEIKDIKCVLKKLPWKSLPNERPLYLTSEIFKEPLPRESFNFESKVIHVQSLYIF